VLGDASTDVLAGQDGRDWFLLDATGSGARDTSDRSGPEVVTDLD
jgi:hypothetical protein